MKKLFVIIVSVSLYGQAAGQNYPLFSNSYFLQLYENPAYANDYTEARLNFRGINDSVTTGNIYNAQFSYLANYKLGFRADFTRMEIHDNLSNSANLNIQYSFYPGFNHRLTVGAGLGYDFRTITIDEPIKNNIPYFRAGLEYSYRNIRLLFYNPYIADKNIADLGSKGYYQRKYFDNFIGSISYRFGGQFVSIIPAYTLEKINDKVFNRGQLLLSYRNMISVGTSYSSAKESQLLAQVSIKRSISLHYTYDAEDYLGKTKGFNIGVIVRFGRNKREQPQITYKHQPDSALALKAEHQEEVPTVNVISETPASTATDPVPVVTHQSQAPTYETVNPDTLLGQYHFVVFGAYESQANAKVYSATLNKQGCGAAVYRNKVNDLYYVCDARIFTDIDEARAVRNNYRLKSRYSFKETWVVTGYFERITNAPAKLSGTALSLSPAPKPQAFSNAPSLQDTVTSPLNESAKEEEQESSIAPAQDIAATVSPIVEQKPAPRLHPTLLLFSHEIARNDKIIPSKDYYTLMAALNPGVTNETIRSGKIKLRRLSFSTPPRETRKRMKKQYKIIIRPNLRTSDSLTSAILELSGTVNLLKPKTLYPSSPDISADKVAREVRAISAKLNSARSNAREINGYLASYLANTIMMLVYTVKDVDQKDTLDAANAARIDSLCSDLSNYIEQKKSRRQASYTKISPLLYTASLKTIFPAAPESPFDYLFSNILPRKCYLYAFKLDSDSIPHEEPLKYLVYFTKPINKDRKDMWRNVGDRVSVSWGFFFPAKFAFQVRDLYGKVVWSDDPIDITGLSEDEKHKEYFRTPLKLAFYIP